MGEEPDGEVHVVEAVFGPVRLEHLTELGGLVGTELVRPDGVDDPPG